jgi:hypothetical protein
MHCSEGASLHLRIALLSGHPSQTVVPRPSHDKRALPTQYQQDERTDEPLPHTTDWNLDRHFVHPCIPSFSSLATPPESPARLPRVRPSPSDCIEGSAQPRTPFPPHFLPPSFCPLDAFRRLQPHSDSKRGNIRGDAESYVRLGTGGRDEGDRGGVRCEGRQSVR